MPSKKKRGRPKSDSSFNITIKARIDVKTNNKLVEYCERNNITKTDVIRTGIKKVIETE